ncbi:MAG: hypothetical protein JW768_09395 [Chitinispirillaceae bacterium]|nr:hypothetical protein [Chitinispirillaceae bacterium]
MLQRSSKSSIHKSPESSISRNSVQRLSQYRIALRTFKELGFVSVFSSFLAETVGINSSQIRKDFSFFRINGKKRGGL